MSAENVPLKRQSVTYAYGGVHGSSSRTFVHNPLSLPALRRLSHFLSRTCLAPPLPSLPVPPTLLRTLPQVTCHISMAGVTGVTGKSPTPAVTPMAGVAGTGAGIVTVAPTTAALNATGANTFIQFTPHELATAPSMDPALEALLRSVNLCEHLISAFRIQEITDRELFLALDTSEESLRDTCKEAFGVDPSKGFAHKREFGKIIKAWNNAKVHSDTKLKIDAVARSHGEPVSILGADWEALLVTFKNKFGTHLHDTLLPAQSYFEGFEERLASGQLRAEPLTQVISTREKEDAGICQTGSSASYEPSPRRTAHYSNQEKIPYFDAF